ncbi:hypothetical protein GCM10010420_01540 [Streptomyces glaucosporus]|uniref:Uncharacterized protein n=1 Tax=Streptomyces glaucosporus TaxID=284044 RepID=A0ABP5UMM1_9ACTN
MVPDEVPGSVPDEAPDVVPLCVPDACAALTGSSTDNSTDSVSSSAVHAADLARVHRRWCIGFPPGTVSGRDGRLRSLKGRHGGHAEK